MPMESPESPAVRMVDLSTDNSIQAMLDHSKLIGIDTEFIREKTYFSKLCLIQLTDGDTVYCADPLNLDADAQDAAGFWSSLMATPWVLHSGRQDIEVLYQACGKMPASLFDTQIAAAFLGYQPQIGYGNLVAELFDVELAKTHTRADWSRRPLPAEFIEYAALDVHYLLPAHEILVERLKELGRLDWVSEDSAAMLDPALYEIDPGSAINRLKGAGKLRGRERAAASELAAWREEEALRRNRPRQWILRDATLLEIAGRDPHKEADLAGISGLGERTIERAGGQLLQRLEAARRQDCDYRPPPRPDESQKKLLKEMRRIVTGCAEDAGIAAELVAPRKELSAATMGNTAGRVFRGWRAALVGDSLRELLDDV